jgi:hypothetical protein
VSWVDSDLAAYWPGDSHVDWAGADLYDVGPPSWLDGPYAFAAAHGKPFFLAEWGVRHGEIDPSRLTCRPDGRSCYQANANDFDHRLLADSDARFCATFAGRTASPRYVSRASLARISGPTASSGYEPARETSSTCPGRGHPHGA